MLPQYPGLNLAAAGCVKLQWTPVKLCIAVWKCDRSALQEEDQSATEETGTTETHRQRGRESRRGKRSWKKKNQKWDVKKFVWAKIMAPAGPSNICTFRYQISSVLCFFCFPPLTFIGLPNGIFIFLTVSILQRSSQRQVLLSHYLVIAAMEDHLFSLWHSERTVTFTEAQPWGFQPTQEAGGEGAANCRTQPSFCPAL